ncbi:hypothetical protein GGS21DRAFT_399556 [Xylaria nigripes]|nr:hypothetical protein GGS21DRAFT_399556 [Xylaria nigripes]
MDAMRGSSPSKAATSADPEQLLNAFRAAALSVTKLYKTSAAAQAKSRSDGYQDCLDDLLAFLDKRNIGLCDGEGWQIRRWATARLDGGDSGPQVSDDDEEVDKAETIASPQLSRPNPVPQPSTLPSDSAPPSSNHPVTVEPTVEEVPMITVPTQEAFTFQSSHPYPQDSYLNIGDLDLSDSIRTNDSLPQGTPGSAPTQTARVKRDKRCPRPRNPTAGHLGRGAGLKRPINFAELFDVGGINFGKDMFGREGKRTRHA